MLAKGFVFPHQKTDTSRISKQEGDWREGNQRSLSSYKQKGAGMNPPCLEDLTGGKQGRHWNCSTQQRSWIVLRVMYV